MVNLNYLQTQLRMAAECIRRGLDALAAEPDATTARHEITNVGSFDVPVVPPGPPVDKAHPLTLAHVLDRADQCDEGLSALRANVVRLERIVLEALPDVCGTHDLFPF
jgi:hypothetical protein